MIVRAVKIRWTETGLQVVRYVQEKGEILEVTSQPNIDEVVLEGDVRGWSYDIPEDERAYEAWGTGEITARRSSR